MIVWHITAEGVILAVCLLLGTWQIVVGSYEFKPVGVLLSVLTYALSFPVAIEVFAWLVGFGLPFWFTVVSSLGVAVIVLWFVLVTAYPGTLFRRARRPLRR